MTQEIPLGSVEIDYHSLFIAMFSRGFAHTNPNFETRCGKLKNYSIKDLVAERFKEYVDIKVRAL